MKLALGTVQFGLDYGINKDKKIPQPEADKILNQAVASGIDLIDTAYIYGDSEKIIGEFSQKNDFPFRIVTKLPADVTDAAGMIDESLKRLNKNIYGYLFHDFQTFRNHPEAYEILLEYKAEKRIKKIGFSLYYPSEAEYILKNNIKCDIIQTPYSILDQRFAKVFKKLKQKGVEIHVRSVFLQGLIFQNPKNLHKRFQKVQNKISRLNELSVTNNIPLSAVCINFAALNPDIDHVVIGVSGYSDFKENFASLKYEDKMHNIYNELLSLNETDEQVIVPTNWEK